MLSAKQIKWTMFTITAAGSFVSMLDAASVNLALYPMSRDLGVSLSQIQWVVVGYMLVLTVLLPFFGKLGDIFSKNKIYSIGFFIFGLGALLSMLSGNFAFLIASRCIEAIGGSMMLSNSQAIIATIFKGARRGKALGLNGCLIAIGGMLGPAIGGMLINEFGWPSVFLPSVPVAVFGTIFALKFLPSRVYAPKIFKFDYKGFVYFTLSLFALLLAISQGYHWGWTSLKIIMLGLISLVFGGLFYMRDLKINYPLIDFSMFKIRPFTFGNLAVMTSYMAMFTNGILLPIYLMEILRFDAFQSGLLILPYSLTLSVAAPISGYMAGKFGSRYLTLAGPCVYIIALILFTTFDTSTQGWQIVLASGIMGIGNGLFQSPSNTAIMTSVSKEFLGIASGILALSRNMGHILGTALTITIFEAFKSNFVSSMAEYSDAFLKAYHLTMGFGILFGVMCFSFAFVAYKPKANVNLHSCN